MNNDKMKKKILVIGLGPIGGIFACHLRASGHHVYGIDIWKDHIENIRQQGILIEKLVTLQAHLNEVQTGIEDLKEQAFDYVVISIKTPYMQALIPEIRKLKGRFTVVSLQNGIDNEEYLADFFNPDRVLRIVINYAGNIISPGKISMSFFHKPNYVGGVSKENNSEAAKEMARLLSAASLETEFAVDIKKFTWKKAILNSVLAPISALLGMTMAEVMTCRETRSLVELLLKEGLAVAGHMGFDYGENFFQQSMDYLSGAGHHKPSMLIDIEKGNPTEIDYINGKIAYYGKKFNIPVPLNTSITSLIKAKEQYPR
ncbi:MAG: 2-dehydropantoate 2-reductase [Candidatus Aminicenantes bacterium]|nr:2-dehydropantoate 2-reductase [Candidatus Aminicenantes bacterium]